MSRQRIPETVDCETLNFFFLFNPFVLCLFMVPGFCFICLSVCLSVCLSLSLFLSLSLSHTHTHADLKINASTEFLFGTVRWRRGGQLAPHTSDIHTFMYPWFTQRGSRDRFWISIELFSSIVWRAHQTECLVSLISGRNVFRTCALLFADVKDPWALGNLG